MIGAPQGPAQEPNSQLAGAEVRTELVNMNDEPHSQSVIKTRKESALYGDDHPYITRSALVSSQSGMPSVTVCNSAR